MVAIDTGSQPILPQDRYLPVVANVQLNEDRGVRLQRGTRGVATGQLDTAHK
jgi:hypothetical protein